MCVCVCVLLDIYVAKKLKLKQCQSAPIYNELLRIPISTCLSREGGGGRSECVCVCVCVCVRGERLIAVWPERTAVSMATCPTFLSTPPPPTHTHTHTHTPPAFVFYQLGILLVIIKCRSALRVCCCCFIIDMRACNCNETIQSFSTR